MCSKYVEKGTTCIVVERCGRWGASWWLPPARPRSFVDLSTVQSGSGRLLPRRLGTNGFVAKAFSTSSSPIEYFVSPTTQPQCEKLVGCLFVCCVAGWFVEVRVRACVVKKQYKKPF